MRKKRPRPDKRLKCSFCQSGSKPDYKEVEVIKCLVDDRGKIIPRIRSGVCAKHQRQLARAIKRSRFLGLIPFTTQV